jgi:FkbM family methyltransferase
MLFAGAIARVMPQGWVRLLPRHRIGRLVLLYADTPLTKNPRRYERLTTHHGFTMSGSTGDLIQRRLFQFGTWEPELTALMKARVAPGDVVVDIGANIGYFTLLAASITGPSGRVLAFEPTPSLAATLGHQVEANGFTNVDLHPVALGDKDGFVTIYRAPGVNTGQSGLHGGVGFIDEGEVPCRLGSDEIPAELWSRITFIKIDVEGEEEHVLLGILPVLDALPSGSTAVIEISHDPDLGAGPTTDHPIVRLMFEQGFTAELLSNDYTHAGYTSRPQGPAALPELLDRQIDVVFTKN